MSFLNDWSLRFVRWGMGLTVLGLVTGYAPLAHYLMKDSLPSCPAAPVHGHTILLSLFLPVFGLVYRALPGWMGNSDPPLRLVRAHFWLAVIGILGVCVNGTLGYEILTHCVQPDFYYLGPAGQAVRNLWFAIDGAFLTAYAFGCLILLYILMTKTAYTAAGKVQ